MISFSHYEVDGRLLITNFVFQVTVNPLEDSVVGSVSCYLTEVKLEDDREDDCLVCCLISLVLISDLSPTEIRLSHGVKERDIRAEKQYFCCHIV